MNEKDLKLKTILDIPSAFVLLIAPPAWGKTRLLHSLFEGQYQKIVFISPLKALSLEFASSFGDGESLSPKTKAELNETLVKFEKRTRAVLSITPELCSIDFYKFLEERDEILVVFDEFHLFYYWGDSFRPLLLECFMGVVSLNNPVLTLTATMSEEMIDRLKFDLANVREVSYVVNVGNQKLKTRPSKIFYFSTIFKRFRPAFFRRFMYELEGERGVILLFCRYRYQVDRWVEVLNRKGVVTLGCKGGEVKSFIDNLDLKSPPRCIVATSTLSHGVNLPAITKIFISYPVGNIDFWIQMVGRGGRRGGAYELYTFDHFGTHQVQRVLSLAKSLFFDLHLSFRSFLMG